MNVPTCTYRIWLAGDAADARRICRQFCMAVGQCVTVTETDFIFTGGQEAGVMVGLLHYPRFPTTPAALAETAMALATALRDGLCQWSVLVEGPEETVWLNRRPGDDHDRRGP